ncbi:glucan biosynthesis protein G [Palleronia sediminis]|uniref:Glucan biosynthesis protein G n=1 Tax=Palleronia sediminis TaxID=2547833 RepID=A0A4R6AEV0_9RHOB|nr:glucan biosynthesis protein G [Palleronia sediminis]TDL81484.1 glucan biosynthesis protein G [Palleronia sediminis]
MTRRAMLWLGGSALASAALAPAGRAQTPEGTPFSYDALVERARRAAAQEYAAPEPLGAPFSNLDYDTYRLIRFRDRNARWADRAPGPVVHAYHPGWLFAETVTLHEVVEGQEYPLSFTAADFIYSGAAKEVIPPQTDLPGVAGFRVNAALNAPDRLDEVLSFLGASYFRALGQDNLYGISARGLAVNTAIAGDEEFPRFSEFWLERGDDGSDSVSIHALLESPSVTGAYRFVVSPGMTTVMDVTLRLFFRRDVAQLGIAPLTSMFLFGPNDEGPFQDYRHRVHDSEALVLDLGETRFVRPLNNPPQLANSYFGAQSPRAFGLVQRHREFADYLDAGAHYELRPSLMVEPLEDWGTGTIRLIEIPSELEANDNIVAFWIPERDFAAGDDLSLSYRLHWGMDPAPARTELGRVTRTLAGFGGVAGVEPRKDLRKFVIDFAGGPLAELSPRTDVKPRVTVSNGTVEGEVLQRVENGENGLWRLVIEVSAERGSTVELKADLALDARALTETWVYQWIRE